MSIQKTKGPNIERLKELLRYEPDTGNFYWMIDRKAVKAGDLAGCCKREENRAILIDGEPYSPGHMAWLYMYGVKPVRLWHINGNVKDFSIKNLTDKRPEKEKIPLTQDKLKELLDYNPDTGIFTWKERISNIKQGTIAGKYDKNWYVVITINNKKYLAHRLAWLYMEGYFPENQIDHIDRNKSNNKWANLREVSQVCNSRNSKLSKRNKSGIRGVTWDKERKKWQVNIRANKKNITLGRYDSKVDAAKARWQAEKKYNFPTCDSDSSAYRYIKEKS
jgi:hypothetical protein